LSLVLLAGTAGRRIWKVPARSEGLTAMPDELTLDDLRGRQPAELRAIIARLDADLADLHMDDAGELRELDGAEQRRWDRLFNLRSRAEARLQQHDVLAATYARHPGAVQRAYGNLGEPRTRTAGLAEVPPRVAEDRNRALRTLDEYRANDVLSAAAADRLDSVLRTKDPMGGTARYLAAVGDPAYGTAFGKMLADPATGHLRFDPAEVEAVRTAGHVQDEMRAMGEGTGAAGQFLLPIQIDPSIILTSAGVLNPVRDVASVETTGAYQWRGVSSTGVTAAYAAEATEASDNSPTLAQPVITPQRGQCFVPFSRELSQDWAAVQTELTRLVTDAKNVVDATMFLTGNGTNQPFGVLGGDATYSLTTTQRVLTATIAVTAVADPWTFKAAIPARWLNSTTFAAAPSVWDAIYRFVAQGSTTEPRQFADGDRGGDFLGRPKIEWSTMATTTTVTGTKIMIAGDFKTAFKIIDRIGMQAEIIPNLFGASGRPTGQRGLYAFWRTGSAVVAQNGLRYLEVK
jgi:HK97 family phage major capsid protein